MDLWMSKCTCLANQVTYNSQSLTHIHNGGVCQWFAIIIQPSVVHQLTVGGVTTHYCSGVISAAFK